MTDERTTEDELANSIIENLSDGEADEPWGVEVPYNYYGDRGMVDLVHRYDTGKGRDAIQVFELKSEYAVSSVTGANEILRQFNRHKEYFFDGSEYRRGDYFSATFELSFTLSRSNVEHILENKEMYASAVDRSKSRSSIVTLRDVGESMPVIFSGEGFHESLTAESAVEDGILYESEVVQNTH